MKMDNRLKMVGYPYELKVDLDRKQDDIIKFLHLRLDMCAKYFPKIFRGTYAVYETNKGYHVHISIISQARLLPGDIILFQSILGDDWLRSLRCVWRVSSGDQVWNILFNYKKKGTKVMREKFMGRYKI